MAEKILTVSEFTQLFQECVPSKTIDKGRLTSALLGTSYTEDARCPVKTKAVNDSGMTTFWQYITNSTIGYAGPPSMYSGMTGNLTNNKLFSLSEITDPRNNYYGGTIGASGMTITLSASTDNTNVTFPGSVELLEFSNDAHTIWTSNALNWSGTGGAHSVSTAAAQDNVIYGSEGSRLRLKFSTTGLTSLDGSSAYIHISDNDTMSLPRLGTGSTGAAASNKFILFEGPLTIDIVKQLPKMHRIGMAISYSGGESTGSTSDYIFQLNAPTTLADTTISLSPLWNTQGTTLYETYQPSPEMAVKIYDQTFKTVVWVDNDSQSSYSNGVLTVPWDVLHPILSGNTQSSMYLRVPMKYSPSNNTIVYPVVLYFQLIPTNSSMDSGQAYGITSTCKVYLDVSNRYNSVVPNAAMEINYSGVSYSPTRYLPNAYTDSYQTYGTSLAISNTGAKIILRDNEPHPHIQYYSKSGTAALYFKTIMGETKYTTINSSRTKVNLMPQGVRDLAYWVEYLKDEGIQYQMTNTSY